MSNTAVIQSPRLAAQIEWMTLGEFNPEQFQGEQRREYNEERARIERQYDNTPE